jgi:hypothetical protein
MSISQERISRSALIGVPIMGTIGGTAFRGRAAGGALEEAVGRVQRGEEDSPVRATVVPAAFPDDGLTVAELMKVADGTLHARTRELQRPVA